MWSSESVPHVSRLERGGVTGPGAAARSRSCPDASPVRLLPRWLGATPTRPIASRLRRRFAEPSKLLEKAERRGGRRL